MQEQKCIYIQQIVLHKENDLNIWSLKRNKSY